jgi:hypothetical protein
MAFSLPEGSKPGGLFVVGGVAVGVALALVETVVWLETKQMVFLKPKPFPLISFYPVRQEMYI